MNSVKSVFFITALFSSTMASAHVGLSTSVPMNGAMLEQPPEVLELKFSAPVRLVRLTMKDERNQAVALSMPEGKESQSQFSLVLPELAPAAYTVGWVVLGNDGHKMQGQFNFILHPGQEGNR
jgi:copper resistance protein C